VLIDDGNVLLKVTDKRTDALVCRCEIGGTISDHKGINLPDSNISAPTLTDKDRRDLDWAMEHEVDFIALSFVRRPEDLRELREILSTRGSQARVVSKIEKPEALQHLAEIIELSDVVLVARGDLGVEMDISRVPIIQKEIALRARNQGRPVIVATQMLQSMVEAPVPTRAEVSDVANAILDDADAVMLSAETSIGKYPLRALSMIRRIAEHTESFGVRRPDRPGANTETPPAVATALVRGANVVARELDIRLVAVWTQGGDTPRLLSRHRLDQPILALTPNEKLCRQMTVLYGVEPVVLEPAARLDETFADIDGVILERGLAREGELIIVTGDTRPDLPGETDALFIHPVGSAGADRT
jgi:pyruvate kinase